MCVWANARACPGTSITVFWAAPCGPRNPISPPSTSYQRADHGRARRFTAVPSPTPASWVRGRCAHASPAPVRNPPRPDHLCARAEIANAAALGTQRPPARSAGAGRRVPVCLRAKTARAALPRTGSGTALLQKANRSSLGGPGLRPWPTIPARGGFPVARLRALHLLCARRAGATFLFPQANSFPIAKS